eukprot:snap_masked-scaffold_12-processed-gene-4.27-mRNA-1 protein AED:1.00 eAED:1.00 QI:0/-1/0/0/-1/1/1/0/372
MRNYTFAELNSLCKTQSISALIWIYENVPKFVSCGSRVVGRTLWNPKTNLVSLLSCSIKLPNLLYAFDNADYAIPPGKKSWLQPLPGVVRYAGLPSHPSFLFPVAEYIRSTTHCHGIYSSNFQLCKLSDTSNRGTFCERNFSAKDDEVFWRGTLTGNNLNTAYLDFNPRYQLVKKFYGQKYFNIGFSSSKSPLRELESWFQSRKKPRVKEVRYCSSKFILHVEGNSFAGSLGYKLSTGSVVLFVDSPFGFHEFYYKRLEPWKHFVPVDADLGNLKEIVQFLIETKEGKEISKEISKNALELFQKDGQLSAERNYCYIARLFYTLAQEQDFEPTPDRLKSAGIAVNSFQEFDLFGKLNRLETLENVVAPKSSR